MPPNRKGTFDTADNLATLNVSQFVETAKFQPLTTPTTLSEAASTPTTPIKPASANAKKYSFFNSDETLVLTTAVDDPAKLALIERILADERLRQQFSVDHLVEVNRSHAEEEKTAAQFHDSSAADNEDYWVMSNRNPTESELQEEFLVKAETTDDSYWDWNGTSAATKQHEKETIVQKILEEERIRQLFTVDHVEERIQQEAAALQKKAGAGLSSHHRQSNDDYWNWETKEDDELSASHKAAIIEQILQEETLRQQFAVARIEEKLTQAVKTSHAASQTNADNDDYWAGF